MKPLELLLVLTSLSLAVLWNHQSSKTAFLEGRASVYKEFAALPSDGTCLAPTGCDR